MLEKSWCWQGHVLFKACKQGGALFASSWFLPATLTALIPVAGPLHTFSSAGDALLHAPNPSGVSLVEFVFRKLGQVCSCSHSWLSNHFHACYVTSLSSPHFPPFLHVFTCYCVCGCTCGWLCTWGHMFIEAQGCQGSYSFILFTEASYSLSIKSRACWYNRASQLALGDTVCETGITGGRHPSPAFMGAAWVLRI